MSTLITLFFILSAVFYISNIFVLFQFGNQKKKLAVILFVGCLGFLVAGFLLELRHEAQLLEKTGQLTETVIRED